MKYKNNIFLGDIKSSIIKIKGNKLNLRWFDSCVIVFSDIDEKDEFLLKLLKLLDLEEAKKRFKR